MKLKSTIAKWSIAFVFCYCLLVSPKADAATYCTPTFSSGCFNWNVQEVTLGTINWTIGSNFCSDFDFTGTSTTLNAGTSYPMSVTSGVWCGCSVWIDFNNDELIEPHENLYHIYVGADPSYTYTFNVAIPSNVPTGSYRMRVIGAWGSDGFTVGGSNGYGSCGSYQYGSFTDFTVNIIGTTVGIQDGSAKNLHVMEVSPNPVSSSVNVNLSWYNGREATLQLTDVTGKVIQTKQVMNATEELDVSQLSKGIYFLHYIDGIDNQNLRLIK